MDYFVLDDGSAVARSAADIVQGDIETSGSTLIGLAGGSTPRATYEELARRCIDWSGATVWMTDERWVPPNSDASNQKMASASLVDPTGVSFLAPDTTVTSIEESAAAYTDTILPVVARADRSLVLLGIGTDGHTASLFPGTAAIGHPGVACVANHVPTLDAWRLTATFGLLATADRVLFIVTGESKAGIVAAIHAGADVPAARVTAREKVLWLLDEAAASGLPA